MGWCEDSLLWGCSRRSMAWVRWARGHSPCWQAGQGQHRVPSTAQWSSGNGKAARSRNKSRGIHPYNKAQSGTGSPGLGLNGALGQEVWGGPRWGWSGISRIICALRTPTSVCKVNSSAPNNHVQKYLSFKLKCKSQKWKMESTEL